MSYEDFNRWFNQPIVVGTLFLLFVGASGYEEKVGDNYLSECLSNVHEAEYNLLLTAMDKNHDEDFKYYIQLSQQMRFETKHADSAGEQDLTNEIKKFADLDARRDRTAEQMERTRRELAKSCEKTSTNTFWSAIFNISATACAAIYGFWLGLKTAKPIPGATTRE